MVNPWSPYTQGVALLMFLLAIQAVSWNIISGYAGYTSLGHSMFLGLGSYTVAIIALHTGVNPLWIAPLGGITAVVVATLAGFVVLRTRGHAFVIITIALLLAAQILAVNLRPLTKGSDGITLELPFWSKDFQNIPFYYAFLLILVLTVLFSAWIKRTKFGTGLIAIREDEGKAAAIGVNTTRFKVLAYAASSFFIGVAGGVYAYFLTFLNPLGAFAILGSVMIVLSALVGGRGTLYGPLVGAFIVQLINEEATVFGGGSGTRVLIMGLLLVLTVLFLPAGLLPTVQGAWRRRHPEEVEYTDQTGALGRPGGAAVTRDRALAELQTVASADALVAGEPLLEIKGVSKRFGGLVAVDDADLTVRKGTITALIGPNGSGKTTLFNLVTGGMQADAGEIWFEGRRIDRMPPWKRGHLGLGRTFQTTRLFKEMTVAAERRRAGAGRALADDVRRRGQRRRGRPGPGAARRGRPRPVRRPARRRPVVRAAEAGRAGPGADAGAEADPARRAGRRRQPEPARPAHRGDPRAQRARHHVPRGRAQHPDGAGALRPGGRVLPRPADRRGRAGGDPQRPGRARRLPRRRLAAAGRGQAPAQSPARVAAGTVHDGPGVTGMLLSLSGVTAGYGGGNVLQGVDLDCAEGTVTCVVGPNGAGKSTVLRVISGLLRCSGGTITMAGDRTDGLAAGRDPAPRDHPGPAVAGAVPVDDGAGERADGRVPAAARAVAAGRAAGAC